MSEADSVENLFPVEAAGIHRKEVGIDIRLDWPERRNRRTVPLRRRLHLCESLAFRIGSKKVERS